MLTLQSLGGLVVFVAFAYFCSNNRKAIAWKLVGTGVVFQFLMALTVLGIPSLGIKGPLKFIFEIANNGIMELIAFTNAGSEFMFGELMNTQTMGFIIAFQVLPTIVFFASLMSVLYHLGVMQFIVNGFAKVMQKLLNLSGAESLAAAANVFVGQTEAPLIVRPYLKNMTQSELFALMTGGMATIAGAVMAAYVGLLKDSIPDIAGHLLTASVLSAPAALVIAKIMIPETKTPETLGRIPKEKKKLYVNVVDAAASGASDGVQLALNVGAMLFAFVALIAMLDAAVTGVGSLAGFEISLPLILSWLFRPVAFLLGMPSQDLAIAGTLIGKKIVFNEFIAYVDLASLGEELAPRSRILLSYALCGFANFSSIAIQIGGIGPLIPERRQELAILGMRSVVGGSLAAFMTAAIAGILI